MTEFTLSVPVGERARREDGVEFVVKQWTRYHNGVITIYGTDDSGSPYAADLRTVTIDPPAPERLEWRVAASDLCHAASYMGVWSAYDNGRLFYNDAFVGIFDDPKDVAREIEDLLACHRREG